MYIIHGYFFDHSGMFGLRKIWQPCYKAAPVEIIKLQENEEKKQLCR
jgi:hypothetical protein